MAGMTGKVLSTAVGALASNAQHLKPVLAPAAEVGKGAGLIIWGTIWKSTVFSAAALCLWISMFAFTFTFGKSGMMGTLPVILLTSLTIFVIIPTVVFILETFRVRKVVAKRRVEIAQQRAQDAYNQQFWAWQAQQEDAQQATYEAWQAQIQAEQYQAWQAQQQGQR